MRLMRAIRQMRPMRLMGLMGLIGLMSLVSLTGCYREPYLHLYDGEAPVLELPIIELQLDI